jgi:alkyl hydroperoxide reductase subunit D
MSIEETKTELMSNLGLSEDTSTPSVESLVAGESRYLRDLRVNVNNVLDSENIDHKESSLLALGVVVNEKNDLLIESFTARAREAGADDAEIAEVHACTSLLATNNVFYRFRHFIQDSHDAYSRMPARIKMNIMARPVLGKEFFELMSLAVSAVNGCEACVKSHEASVRQLGSTEARIFDAVRLAAVIRGLCMIIR